MLSYTWYTFFHANVTPCSIFTVFLCVPGTYEESVTSSYHIIPVARSHHTNNIPPRTLGVLDVDE